MPTQVIVDDFKKILTDIRAKVKGEMPKIKDLTPDKKTFSMKWLKQAAHLPPEIRENLNIRMILHSKGVETGPEDFTINRKKITIFRDQETVVPLNFYMHIVTRRHMQEIEGIVTNPDGSFKRVKRVENRPIHDTNYITDDLYQNILNTIEKYIKEVG